jgi:hypothetical protein
LRAEDVPNIAVGRNAFFIHAIPDEQQASRPSAVQVRILRDNEVIAENTLWAEPNRPVDGEVLVEVE